MTTRQTRTKSNKIWPNVPKRSSPSQTSLQLNLSKGQLSSLSPSECKAWSRPLWVQRWMLRRELVLTQKQWYYAKKKRSWLTRNECMKECRRWLSHNRSSPNSRSSPKSCCKSATSSRCMPSNWSTRYSFLMKTLRSRRNTWSQSRLQWRWINNRSII